MSTEKPRRGRPSKKEVAQEVLVPTVEEQDTVEVQEEETITMSLEEALEQGLLDDLLPHQSEARHTQIFDEDINVDSVQKLINELNNYSKIDLFFSTVGGQLTAMEALIHYLNSRKEDIAIYLTEEICSAGTFLLTDFEGELYLSENLDFILFHMGDRLMYSNRKSGAVSKKELMKQLKAINKTLTAKFEKLGLTPQEVKKFKQGYDVILYRKDFHRLNINRAFL